MSKLTIFAFLFSVNSLWANGIWAPYLDFLGRMQASYALYLLIPLSLFLEFLLLRYLLPQYDWIRIANVVILMNLFSAIFGLFFKLMSDAYAIRLWVLPFFAPYQDYTAYIYAIWFVIMTATINTLLETPIAYMYFGPKLKVSRWKLLWYIFLINFGSMAFAVLYTHIYQQKYGSLIEIPTIERDEMLKEKFYI